MVVAVGIVTPATDGDPIVNPVRLLPLAKFHQLVDILPFEAAVVGTIDKVPAL